MKQFPILFLKGSIYMEMSLYSLPVPSHFGERAGFDMNTGHVCLQFVLAGISLVEGRAGRGDKAVSRCELGLFALSALHHPNGMRVGPQLRQVPKAEALGIDSELALFAVVSVLPPFDTSTPAPKGSGFWRKRSLCRLLLSAAASALAIWSQRESRAPYVLGAVNAAAALLSCSFGAVCYCVSQTRLFLVLLALLPLWSCKKYLGLEQFLSLGWAC